MVNRDFLVTLIAVISFAGLGTYIRVSLSELISPFNLFSLVPNIVGSLILGVTKGATLKHKYLNKGIGTGLCGSITTFSSFNYEFNILIINSNPNIRLALIFIAVTFIISCIAFYIGESISKCISNIFTQEKQYDELDEITGTNPTVIKTDDINLKLETKIQTQIENNETETEMVQVTQIKIDENDKTKVCKQIKLLVILEWIMFFIIMNGMVIFLCFTIDDALWLASLLAPFGVATRFYLGLKFNKNNRFGIPIGTLMANILGSLLLTLVIVISKQSEDIRDETIWIEGITKGFCGCLSTVSSFVGELFTLQRDGMKELQKCDGIITWKDKMKTYKLSGIYFLVTIIIAQLLSSIPNSIVTWKYIKL
eukprot:130545_1